MLKDSISLIVRILLDFLILFRTPKSISGLSNFESKNNLFGSPGQTEKFLNRLTTTLVLIYFYFSLNLEIKFN